MPASRRRNAPRKQVDAVSPSTAEPLESSIKRDASVRMRRRLNLTDEEQLPEGVNGLIATAAKDVVENAVEMAVLRDVERAARTATEFGGAAAVTERSDLALLEKAEALAAKKKALEAAGFTSEEAMQILTAEIAAGTRP